MIFADKLIKLRKRAGYSQEELAEKMGVTRQSVSKWESAQSIPDIEKIIKISELFGVSTDYLLKDNIEETADINKDDVNISVNRNNTADEHIRKVCLDEAEEFMAAKRIQARVLPAGVFMYILSPIAVILSNALEGTEGHLYEGAETAGLIIMFIMIAAATALVVFGAFKTSPYEYLEEDVFETEDGVYERVKNEKEQYRRIYVRNHVIGISLCILSVIPLFMSQILDNGLIKAAVMASFMFVIVGTGVFLIVKSGTMWGGFERLLQEGDYSREKKEETKKSLLSAIYWPLVTAVYLIYSFTSGKWAQSWIIWVAASIIYPALKAAGLYITKDKKQN